MITLGDEAGIAVDIPLNICPSKHMKYNSVTTLQASDACVTQWDRTAARVFFYYSIIKREGVFGGLHSRVGGARLSGFEEDSL